jgi:ribosomal protein L22
MTTEKENTTNEKQEKTEIVDTQKDVKEIKKEPKKEIKPKIKKTEAFVRGNDIPISTKTAAGICRFIKGKKIEHAIAELEGVIKFRRAMPLKGEIPHRKGKIMSGRYPQNASKHFINLLKTLSSNSDVNGLDNPVINEASANIGQRPYGRFGAVRRKRTHVMIRVIENKTTKKNK